MSNVATRITVTKEGNLNYQIASSLNIYRAACRRYAGLIYKEVRKLSRNRGVSLFELKAMGHPYSKTYPNNTNRSGKSSYSINSPKKLKSGKIAMRRTTRSPSDLINSPWLVNNQSGDFYRKWELVSSSAGNTEGFNIRNTSRFAALFSGKRNDKSIMIPRPIIQKAVANVRSKSGMEGGTLKKFVRYYYLDSTSRIKEAMVEAKKGTVNELIAPTKPDLSLIPSYMHDIMLDQYRRENLNYLLRKKLGG